MKLATLRDGTRDGRLAVVSRDLARAVPADGIARTAQAALDDWDRIAPQLYEIAVALDAGGAGTRHAVAFDPAQAMAILPRAYQWIDGSAYLNHVELVRRSRGASMPPDLYSDPLMYQGGSDAALGPCDDIGCRDEAWGIDFESEVAVIVGDVAMGIDPESAIACVRLITLVNDVSLRHLIPAELAKGFGFLQAKPASAFAPVAVTPDELGESWREGRLHGALQTHLNGALFGRPDAGADMHFGFGELIAHAAKTRRLGAGTIVGSGTVSNRENGGPGRPAAEGGVGYSCIAEQRTVEIIEQGEPSSPFLSFGDRVRIEMHDRDGRSIFGAIDQLVRQEGEPEK